MPSLKLPLTTAGANWIVKRDRGYDSLASWDVASDGWPPASVGDPLYVAILPPALALLGHSTEQTAESTQRMFDPQENREWVFVPDVTGTACG